MGLRQDQSAQAAPAARPAASVAVIDAMHRHLVASRPTSGNEALRLLRSAFPHVPLADRVAAVDAIRRYAF